jgi:zinc D-Ala-D-Ala carboxypeptidase
MNLSPHFTLEELTHTEHRKIDNTPTQDEINNLQRLANFLEEVKTVLGGRAIIVSSGFRCKALNDAVGSKDTSQHRLGAACDFRVPGMSPDEVVRAVIASDIKFDQVIREFNAWTHLSIPSTQLMQPRRQALIIDKAGTRTFEVA